MLSHGSSQPLRPYPKELLRSLVSGAHIGKPSNKADAILGRNPSGRGYFCAFRRCSSLVWNDQMALLAPWTAQK
jgi:hypothetical protein